MSIACYKHLIVFLSEFILELSSKEKDNHYQERKNTLLIFMKFFLHKPKGIST